MKVINSNQDIVDYLSAALSCAEKSLINDLQGEIQELSSKKDEIDPKRWRELSIRRLFGSGNLGQGQGKEQWDRANAFIHERILENNTPTLSTIKEINKVINPTSQGQFRQSYSRAGNKRFVTPENLDYFLTHFEDNCLKSPHSNSIWQAFLIYSWGITLHPFEDGNGRTFRLCSDWTLLQSSLLPLSYDNAIAAHVAVAMNTPLPNRIDKLRNFLKALRNSYLILFKD